MPTIYVKLQHTSQQGYNSTGENYTNGGFNYGMKTDRVNIFRFTHVPVPKGSTITSATLYGAVSVKNNNAQSLTYNFYTDSTINTLWLDTTRNEWTTGVRSWANYSASNVTFNWNTAGEAKQLISFNVKPHIEAIIAHTNWTLAGGSASFRMSITAITAPDEMYFHTINDGYGPILEINYTPPASDGKSTVVNVQENCSFNRATNAAAAFYMEPYGFTNWFGTYTQPTYSILSSPPVGVTATPFGGKLLRVQAPSGRPMVHLGVPTLEDGEWYNYSCYTYIPTTAPSGMGVSMAGLGDKYSTTDITTKGQWIRHDISFIADGNIAFWGIVHGSGTVWDSTAEFYVANVQLTKGRVLRPYIDGSRTMTNADYGWAGADANGFVRAVAPTATMATQYDKARSKSFAVDWTYGSTPGHAQENATIKIRKVR